MADQGLLAGASFVTTVLVGRTVAEADFGVFALAFAGLMLSERLQQGLVGAPLLSASARREGGSSADYARAAAMLQIPIAGTLVVVSVASGTVIAGASDWPRVFEATLGLAVGLVFVQMRDLVRYTLYAAGDAVRAATVSTVGTALQLTALGALAATSRLTVGTALMAIAAGALGAALVGGGLTRRVWLGGSYSGLPWGELLRSGRWLGASSAALWAAMQAFLFGVAVMVGPAQAGAFRAAQSVLGPTQFVTAGLFNVGTPRAAAAVREGTGPWRSVGSYSAASLALVGSYCALAALFPSTVLGLLFGGRYLGEGPTVQAMSVGYLFMSLAAGMMMGLVALPRTDRVFVAHLVSLLAAVLLAYPLISRFGVVGAATGLSAMMIVRFASLAGMLRVST